MNLGRSKRLVCAAPPKTANLSQHAYNKIRIAIVYAHFDLGEPLSENELAKAMGISKAPVRNAIRELRLNGLVEIIPQSGTYVFSPTTEEVGELCDFRSLLERQALHLGMEHNADRLLGELQAIVHAMSISFRTIDIFRSKLLDSEFHSTIVRHSENRFLKSAYERIAPKIEALRHRFMDTELYRNKAFFEHEQMVKLLQERRVQKASGILEDHISRTKQFQTGVRWSSGRLQRKDYRFRQYATIFKELEGLAGQRLTLEPKRDTAELPLAPAKLR